MSRSKLAFTALFLSLTIRIASAETAFTANESDNTVSVIDTITGTSSKISLSFAPHNVDLSTDRRTLLVTGMMTMGAGAHQHTSHAMGKLLLIDIGGPAPALLAEYSAGAHPAHVVADHDGRTVYISDSGTNQVLVFHLAEKRITGGIAVGQYPHGIRLSPDGGTLAVANLKGRSISLVDIRGGKEKRRIDVGAGPVQVAFTPAGDKVLVALNGENKAVLVDVGTGKIVKTFEVGRGPVQVFVTPDGKTGLVANQGTKSRPDNRVSILDLSGRIPVRHLSTEAGSHGVFISPDGGKAFVTNTYANSLSVIDIPASKVVKTLPTGREPNGVVAR